MVLSSISKFVIGLNWKKIATIGSLELRQLKTEKPEEYYFRLGFMTMVPEDDPEKERFRIVGVADLRQTHVPGLNAYYICEMAVAGEYQDRGIAKELYKILIKDIGLTITSNSIQLFCASTLWSSPSKMPDLIVDVINMANGQVIVKDEVIVHGVTKSSYDKNNSRSEMELRFILKDVR